VEKAIAPPPPVAAIQSDRLSVDNDLMRDNAFDIERFSRTTKTINGKSIVKWVALL
jgi:hypothetical protein